MKSSHLSLIDKTIERYGEWLECEGVDSPSFLIDILARDLCKANEEIESLRKMIKGLTRNEALNR